MSDDDEFDPEQQHLLFRALERALMATSFSVILNSSERDCVALVAVINQLGSMIDSIAREWPEGVGLPDDALEQPETIDRPMERYPRAADGVEGVSAAEKWMPRVTDQALKDAQDEHDALLDDAVYWIREAAQRTSRINQRTALRNAIRMIDKARLEARK